MREYSTPLSVDLPAASDLTGNLTDDLLRNVAEAPDAVALSRRAPGGGEDGAVWDDVTTTELLAQVRAVAKGLVAAGLEPGDRVALVSRTRWEWTVLDYAIWCAGAVTVPVYETSSAAQVEWILQDSGATAVLAETQEHLARITSVRAGLESLHHVWTIDPAADSQSGRGALEVLSSLGADVSDETLEERRTAVGPESLATLIYTSGTTGRPKGCMLTHANFMTEIGAAVHELDALFAPGEDGEQPSTLLFLPLAHVFARIIQIGAVRCRVRLGHSSDVRNLVATLQEFRPTFVLAVPRVFEKVFNTASQRATADGRGAIFEKAAETAIAWSRGLDGPKGRASLAVRARHAVFDRLVYGKLREALGGACTHAVSGGAPLGERLGHFYRGIGLVVLEGYGLTETTAAVTVNLPEAQRIGSVGRPLPGTAVRVADDGELLFHGGQVFTGYWHADQATAEALEDDGWFHTGDVGEVDDEGFVRITGRKKEILVTAGGKNVAPAVLEDRLRAHALVSQALVVGDRQPFIAALVTLDADALPLWAEAQGKNPKKATPADLATDADLVAEVQRAVDEANTAVSKAESIRKFRVLTRDWTEEDGQLTPSLKLRRNVVMREHKDEIAALYL